MRTDDFGQRSGTKGASPSALRTTMLDWWRTRAFEIYVLLMSLPFGAAILTYFKITCPIPHVRAILFWWSTAFIYGAKWIMGVRWKLEGYEKRPRHPVIYCANHQSYWESIAMTHLIRDVNVVTKKDAMRIPVFGWGLRESPMIPVDRGIPGHNIRRMLREAKTSLEEGRSIFICPEGTRVDPGERRAFERGLEMLYRHCGVEVVPVVTNAGVFWPRGFQTKRRGTILLRFLTPIPPGKPGEIFAEEIETLLNTEKDRLPGVQAFAKAKAAASAVH